MSRASQQTSGCSCSSIVRSSVVDELEVIQNCIVHDFLLDQKINYLINCTKVSAYPPPYRSCPSNPHLDLGVSVHNLNGARLQGAVADDHAKAGAYLVMPVDIFMAT